MCSIPLYSIGSLRDGRQRGGDVALTKLLWDFLLHVAIGCDYMISTAVTAAATRELLYFIVAGIWPIQTASIDGDASERGSSITAVWLPPEWTLFLHCALSMLFVYITVKPEASFRLLKAIRFFSQFTSTYLCSCLLNNHCRQASSAITLTLF